MVKPKELFPRAYSRLPIRIKVVFQQSHDSGDNFGARQAGTRQIFGDARAQHGQNTSDGCHTAIFGLIANLPPAWVITVLLTAFRISPGGLQMAVGKWTDPNTLPGWRYNQ